MISSENRIRVCLVFLLTMAMLSLEVALTRIFSYIMHYHFTYLAISVAMLGFGAAGTYLTIREKRDEAPAGNEFLGKMSALLALATITAIAFIPRIHFYPLDIYFRKDYSNLLSLLAIVILAGSPFFFGGTCIAYIISRAGKDINRIYFADLIGAAAGCLLVIILINSIGAVATCFGVASLAMLVAVISSERRRVQYSTGLFIGLVLTVVVACTEPLPLYVPRHKQMFGKEHLVERVDWHIITRLDTTRPVEVYYSFAGALSPHYDGDPQKIRIIYQDASALTGIIQPAPAPEQTSFLGYYLQGAPCKVKSNADVLVIGCGGGVDILIALYHGARHVVGVDVNPDMIKLLKRYGEFARGVFQREDVELVVAEGRHFLSRDQRRYDVIQLSGVDTFSALSTGAYALTENFIYTIEAFEQYFNHLKNDGIVNISRAFFTPPRETLKMIAMWMRALERLGVENPKQHIMILNGWGQHRMKVEDRWQMAEGSWAQTLVKRSAFTPEEVSALTGWTEWLGFEVIYDPYTSRNSELEALITASTEQRQQIINGHRLNISPATDNKPFFFRFHRWDHLLRMAPFCRGGIRPPLALLILLGSLGIVTVLSAGFIIYPLYKHSSAARTGGRVGIFIYFAALGLAFIFIEIALIQKLTVFLGGPGYSMSITLFTILLASGTGSFLSRNWSSRPFRLLATVIPLLVAALIVELFFVNHAIPRLMYLSHPIRALAVVAMLAPLAILMGMPFPAGLRHVDNYRPELNPWAWGINACATVMGAVLCILISSLFGFTTTLLIGAAVYLIGWTTFYLSQPRTLSAH